MSDDPVVTALRAALSVRDGAELRLALGERLLSLGLARDALEELERALELEPSNPRVLEAAADAADQLGDAARATSYRLALTVHAAPPPTASPSPEPGPRDPREESGAGDGQTEPGKADDARRLGGPSPTASPPQPATQPERPHLRLVSPEEPFEEDVPSMTFADIGGLDDVKQRLTRSFLLPLQQPELFAKFGKSLRGGLLLYGPPGCGKTFIARALAGEIGARFFSVAISDVLDMWLGESERKLHELFENARRRAPAVLFFDEVDTIGQRRTQLKFSAGRNIVNQFLTEMDGLEDRNKDLFVLGATNHPWDVDPALRRPGRFDRMVFVPAPDCAARQQILALKLEDRPTVPKLDLEALARSTETFSGADLQALVDAATELAFELTVESGSEHAIDMELLERALAGMRASTRPWLETARNYAVYANEGGTYDDLLAFLKRQGLA